VEGECALQDSVVGASACYGLGAFQQTTASYTPASKEMWRSGLAQRSHTAPMPSTIASGTPLSAQCW
jgi:hypothetical protein